MKLTTTTKYTNKFNKKGSTQRDKTGILEKKYRIARIEVASDSSKLIIWTACPESKTAIQVAFLTFSIVFFFFFFDIPLVPPLLEFLSFCCKTITKRNYNKLQAILDEI